jgi:hypothetical protein
MSWSGTFVVSHLKWRFWGLRAEATVIEVRLTALSGGPVLRRITRPVVAES